MLAPVYHVFGLRASDTSRVSCRGGDFEMGYLQSKLSYDLLQKYVGDTYQSVLSQQSVRL